MSAHIEGDDSLREYQIGRQEMAAGNYDQAIEHFQISIKHYPHFKTLELLGESMLAIGDPLGSIVPLAAAVGLGTREFRALYLLSKALVQLGDHKDAVRYLDRALEMAPDFKRALELRSQIAQSENAANTQE